MHQTLYRKYRPKVFDDVCGQDHITSVLRYETAHGKTSHAYLFCGPRGTGKTTCAKILAKAINCENPINGNPCGKCQSCLAIDSGSAPDVVEMDAASNNGVDDIRDIIDAVQYTPAMLKKRVYIVDEVHMLTTQAFNALLKTLEEPPEHVVFILATTEIHKLLPTIISRCQRFDFRRIRTEVVASRLTYIAGEESIALEPQAASTLAKHSQGCMRDAISMFELCSAGGNDVTSAHVADVLGLAGIQILYKTAYNVAKNNAAGLFGIVAEVAGSSRDISVYWSDLISFWRDMLVYIKLPENERANYLDYTEDEMKMLGDAAKRFTPEKITYNFRLMDDAMQEMTRLPQNKRTCAELTLIRMADPSSQADNDALAARIASLEEKVSMLESGIVVGGNTPSPTPAMFSETPVKAESRVPAHEEVRESAPVQAPDMSAAQNAEEFRAVNSLGDVAERLIEKNPGIAGFIGDCDCAVSTDGRHVVITAPTRFSMEMLKREEVPLRAALKLCGISDNITKLDIIVGEVKKKSMPIDEIQSF